MDNKIMVPTINSQIGDNAVWCCAFQQAWNDFQNSILYNTFTYNEKNDLINDLIDCSNIKTLLNPSDIYVKHGGMGEETKEEIKYELLKKFQIKKSIIDKLQFDNPMGMIIYSILCKNLTFSKKYKIFKKEDFKGQLIKHFGFESGDNEYSKKVFPLFYVGNNDFAIKLNTKRDTDTIILYRTDDKKNFKEAYEDVLSKTNELSKTVKYCAKSFKAPFLNFKVTTSYDKLNGENFIDEDRQVYTIVSNEQELIFELTNEGARIRSEAYMKHLITAKYDNRYEQLNDYIFNGDYYLFIVDNYLDEIQLIMNKNKENNYPCLAIRGSDIDLFQEKN